MQPNKAGHACQAAGCTAVLAGNDYYSRRRLCAAHAKADAVCRRGHGSALFRWCQQCGRLEPLALFEGVKRSCRASLERRRAQARGKPLPKCQPLGAPGAVSPSRDSAAEAPLASAAAAWQQQPGIAAVGGRAVLASPAGDGHVSGAAPCGSFGAFAGAGVAMERAWTWPGSGAMHEEQLQHAVPLVSSGAARAMNSCQPLCMLSAAEVQELVEHLLGEQAHEPHEPHEPQLPTPSFGVRSGDSTGGSAAPVLTAAAVAAQLEATFEQELQAAATAARAPVGGTSSRTAGTLPPPACAPAAPELRAVTAADPFQPQWCHEAAAAGTGLRSTAVAPAAWLATGGSACAFAAPAAGADSSADIRARLQALQAQARCLRATLQQLRAEYASLAG